MKKLYIIIVLFCFAVTGYAQTAASYYFTATPGTYTSIAGTTGVTAGSLVCDECAQTSILLGFTFKYCGTNYTRVAASSNGTISFANTSSTPYANASANIPGAGFLMPFWDDLSGTSSSSITPASYYITTGTAPNRVFTFEWKDFRHSLLGSAIQASFQVKLYETSNIVEFIYGPSITTGSLSSTFGISNSTTDWQTLPNTGSSPVPSSITFSNIASFPSSGQIYRWQARCSGSPVPGTISATVSTGCASYVSLLSLTGSETGVAGITYQWASSPTNISLSTFAAIPGATNNTYTASVTGSLYYICAVTCTYGSFGIGPEFQLQMNAPAPVTGPDSVCEGATITLVDTTAGGAWSSSNTSISTITTGGVVSGVAAGTATISYTSAGCTATKNIYVNPLPVAGVISGPYYVCPTPINFSETATGGTWGITNASIAGVSISGAVFAIAPGLDTVTYAVTNGCGTSTALFPINTTPCLNGLEKVNSNAALQLELYPNPNNGAFTIYFASGSNEPVNITVTDLPGKQVKNFTANTNNPVLIETDLPKGMYFITASTAHDTRTSKLIVE